MFDIIEVEPDRLREVDGIGPVRAQRITAAWAEQEVVSAIMVFPHSDGVSTGRAVRIYETYGADAVQAMTATPIGWNATSAALASRLSTRSPSGSGSRGRR